MHMPGMIAAGVPQLSGTLISSVLSLVGVYLTKRHARIISESERRDVCAEKRTDYRLGTPLGLQRVAQDPARQTSLDWLEFYGRQRGDAPKEKFGMVDDDLDSPRKQFFEMYDIVLEVLNKEIRLYSERY